MKQLALEIGGQRIQGPGGVPEGGSLILGTIISTFINVLILGGIFMTLAFLIWGGVNWTMSQGDKEKIKMAQNKIKYSIIGLIVVLFSFFIMSIYGQIFGITFFGG